MSQHLASVLGFLRKGHVPDWQLCSWRRRREKSQVPGAFLPGGPPGPSLLQAPEVAWEKHVETRDLRKQSGTSLWL